MSIVIVGGHDRMVCRYKEICKEYKCKVKVFTHMKADMKRQLGSPDLVILFTSTVSHKMVHSAVTEAKRCESMVMRSHSSSAFALTEMLRAYFTGNEYVCVE